VSGRMAHGHEHKFTWVETAKVNSTLEEWIDLGWELVTAYCGPSGSTVTHYLYFRREVGGHVG